jgi:hypothetical protein
MVDGMADTQVSGSRVRVIGRRCNAAWILVLIVDVGFVAWGAMAAALPDRLLGPGGVPILTAGYEGFTRGSWSELVSTSPMTARYIDLLFRMYGIFNVAFGLTASAIAVTAFRRGDGWAWWALLVGNTITLVSAMTYDWSVNAIGPFELSEYLGLAAIYVALAITAPFLPAGRQVEGRADALRPGKVTS